MPRSQESAAVEASPGDPVMPWERGGFKAVLPKNAVTGYDYRGINILSLWITGRWSAATRPDCSSPTSSGPPSAPRCARARARRRSCSIASLRSPGTARGRKGRDRHRAHGARLLGVRRRKLAPKTDVLSGLQVDSKVRLLARAAAPHASTDRSLPIAHSHPIVERFNLPMHWNSGHILIAA